MSRWALTKAQERELVLLFKRETSRVRPLSLRKFRLLGLLEGDGLSDDGVIRARVTSDTYQPTLFGGSP